MALNWKVVCDNIVNISQVLADFLDIKNPKKVKWVYVKENGDVSTVEVNNLGAVIKALQDSVITPNVLANELKKYYNKIEVDAIKNTILKIIDDNKTEIINKVNDIGIELKNEINQRQKDVTVLNNITNVLDKRTIMSETEYQALAEARRKIYAGSGVVEFGNTYAGLRDPYRFTLKDLWNHGWPGCCNFRIKMDPDKYAHYANTAKGLNWSREGWSYVGGSINPVFNVNGYRIVIRGINQSKAYEPCVKNVIGFSEPPTVKAVVTNSTSLPVELEQGDFIILKDLNRNLLNTLKNIGNIDNWENTEGVNISKDSKGNLVFERTDNGNGRIDVIFRFSSIKGLKTSVTITNFSIVSNDNNNRSTIIVNQNGSDYFYIHDGDVVKDKSWTLHYSTTNSASIIVRLQNKNDKVTIDPTKFIIRQVEEQPVIALQNVEQNVDIYQNVDKFETRDSVSRQDLIFLEVWDEDISDKDIVYPFGNVQYQGGDVEGLNGIAAGTFKGADTYSLFGNWQKAGDLIGKGYVWSKLTEDQKIALASNPDHNIRKKGDIWLQTRYRIRVVKGLGNDWVNVNDDRLDFVYSSVYKDAVAIKGDKTSIDSDYTITSGGYRGLFYKDGNVANARESHGLFGGCCKKYKNVFALPIALVQRRNDGIYNKIFNPEGTAQAYDKSRGKLLEFGEFALDDSFITSLEDCFDVSKIAAITKDNDIVPADDSSAVNRSGYIMSKMSGNESELYADEINERDVEDLRMLAKKKPYNEILNEYLQKAIEANIRGKEVSPTVKLQTFWLSTSSTENKKDGGIFIWFYDSSHRHCLCCPYQDYTGEFLLRNGVRKNNVSRQFVVEWIDKNEISLGFDLITEEGWCDQILSPKPDGTAGFRVFYKTETRSVQNNTITQTDIIGDPRKLQDRVSLTVESSDTTVVLRHNTYVLCNDNANNKGNKGHYYRYLGDDLNAIHTNSTDGDANADKGHIDFSDTTKWLDLGNDGAIGGYPDIWLEKGFQGTPLVVGEEGESLLPINARIYPNIVNEAVIGFDDSRKGFYVKLSKKLKRLRRVSVSKKDGGWVDYDLIWYNLALHAGTGNGWDPEIKNRVYFNLNNDSLSALGYSSLQEAYDLMQVIVIYDTYANFLEIANNNTILDIIDRAYTTGPTEADRGNALNEALINKVVSQTSESKMPLKAIFKYLPMFRNNTLFSDWDSSWREELIHEPIVDGLKDDKGLPKETVTKYLPYLTQSNNRAYLQFVFKEMKFSSDTNSWGDDNKFQIVDKVSTVTDLNGKKVLIGQKRVALPYFIVD